MNRHLTASLCALAFSASAMASTDVSIDALQHCLDTAQMAGGKTVIALAPGRYVASLVNNTMSCGAQDANCKINTVVIQSPHLTTQTPPVSWGMAIKEPVVVDVVGTGSVDVYAFVLDSYCADNTGAATLRFQLAR